LGSCGWAISPPIKLSPALYRIRDGEEKEKHVGRKSSTQDKGEGAIDKAKGKAKEAAGAVSGDEAKKAQGRSEQTKGTAKDKKGEVKDLLK
jgi:uncharacterized protein YjbJ (UPF0337 family)